jgi:peptidyl-prolyl cis-trans isomerase C
MNHSSVRARQIVISISPGKEAEAEAKARRVLALAKQPNANFIALLQQFSDDPAKELGGDLGVLKRGDALPAMEEVLFSLQKGQVGGPIKTDDRYHIVQVVEKTMPKPLSQVQMQIVEQLQMKKLEKILLKQVEELRSEAQIKIYVPWGKDP